MSIRINLMMGYGLTDLECDKSGIITDSRIKPVGYIGLSQYGGGENFTIDRFKEYVQSNIDNKVFGKYDPDISDQKLYFDSINQKIDINNYIVHDAEMGLPTVLCLIPPNHYSNWYRHDNTIDYYLSSANIFPMGNPESWVRKYDFNFFPYNGYIDIQTGEYLGNPQHDLVHELYRRTSTAGIWDKDSIYSTLPDYWVDQLECTTVIEATERYVKAIPGCLKAFIQYTKLFTSDDVIYQLKPIIYSYWS